MIDRPRFLTLASATALSLALGHAYAQQVAPGAAQPAAAAPAAEAAPPAPAPGAAPPAPAPVAAADAARQQAEQRRAEATAERDKRYAELRARAAEMGLELPEMPPWEQAGMPGMPQPPAMPMMPEGMPEPPAMPMMPEGMPEGMMRPGTQMTPEERQAMREKRWEAMREQAAERGMELPETPPWEAAQKRREEMLKRYEEYRAIIEAMTDEQKEAISALFSGQRPMRGLQMPMGPCGKSGGYGPCGGGMGPGWGPGMGPGMGPAPEKSPGGGEQAPAAPEPEAPAQPAS